MELNNRFKRIELAIVGQVKKMTKDDSGMLQVTDQILEIAVGAILIGSVEIIGINMITNATLVNADPSVKTMITVVLVILIVIADVYIFIGAVKKAQHKGSK